MPESMSKCQLPNPEEWPKGQTWSDIGPEHTQDTHRAFLPRGLFFRALPFSWIPGHHLLRRGQLPNGNCPAFTKQNPAHDKQEEPMGLFHKSALAPSSTYLLTYLLCDKAVQPHSCPSLEDVNTTRPEMDYIFSPSVRT